ncbi:MAG: hypothetical protein RLW61_08810 [Gammaproteobacteria bacterium]
MRFARAAAWLLVALAPAVPAAEQPFAAWNVRGVNTLRLDHYESNGFDAASPYPFEGGQAYDEFALDFDSRDRPYARWNGQLYGVLNANRYRSPDDVLVPERVNLTREVGDRGLPYRWQLGDYFANFSYMTQQRSLKGVHAEVQPGLGGLADSLVIFAGSNEPLWQDFSADDDTSVGASYLADGTPFGSWAFNLVYNHREAVRRFALPTRDQVVGSVAVAHDFTLGTHALSLDGEYGVFAGDHNGAFGATPARDRMGQGVVLELRGRHLVLPLDYRLRGERHDRDFRPRGGVITPDRRSAEAHAGWRFASGLTLRGRVQAFDTAFQSGNRLERRTVGVNLSGVLLPRWLPAVSGVLDTFYQTSENQQGGVDSDLTHVSLDFNAPLWGGWFGRFGALLQDTDGENALARARGIPIDQTLWQLAASADRVIRVGDLNVFVTPGMLVRQLRQGVAEGNEFQPTFAMRVDGGAHSFGLNYGLLAQDRLDGSGVPDVDTHRFSTDYRYTHGRHVFGAELSVFERVPTPGQDTNAWNAAVYWSFSFDRPAPQPARTVATAAPRATAPLAPRLDSIDVAAIAPGADLARTRAELGGLGAAGATTIGDYAVYEHQVLPQIFQRQRLVLGTFAGDVEVAALVIGIADAGAVDSVEQTFERVRRALIDRYGPPARLLEEGAFGPNLVADLDARRFLRVMEWDTESGVLRFGIPRRLDGQVRMELQHRARFAGGLQDTRWSLEEVR